MDITFKTCVYTVGQSLLKDNINTDYFNGVGFDISIVQGGYHDLFSFLSKKKTDITVIDAIGIEKEDLNYVVGIVYENFCKNIILVCAECNNCINVDNIYVEDWHNFDLKIFDSLLTCRRKIEQNPHYNAPLIKRKISEILFQMMFCSKHDGFKYYVEASTIAYLRYPYDYSTMELYKEVAEKYGKTIYAVEKCMRSALLHAFKRVKNASLTPENAKIKDTFTYDLNNNMAISMIVSKLLVDKNLNEKSTMVCNQ